MTTPDGQLRPPQPWLDLDGCRVCGHTEIATISLYGGRRCAHHPDHYEPHVTITLRLAGWNDTADAYNRTWARTAPDPQ